MEFRSALYVVPTPIGNLSDITFRAIEVLQKVDKILAEDTRTVGMLLKHYNIKNSLASYHMHNEHKAVESIISELKAGKMMALVTDAGTPGISDPGYLLISKAIEAGLSVECLPGATAFVPALVCSGLPCDRFVFEGFLPMKKGRQTRLARLAHEERTIVLYESPHRLLKTLQQLAEHLGPHRRIAACRELTKMHEEIFRGSLAGCIEYFNNYVPRGEFVLIVEGGSD